MFPYIAPFPNCQADKCYAGIDSAFKGDKALISAYCKLYSTRVNFSQRSDSEEDITDNCGEKDGNVDGFQWVSRPIRGENIAKQCQCVSADEAACKDDKCYETMKEAFAGNKDHMSAYCSLKAGPNNGDINGELHRHGACMMDFNNSFSNGTMVNWPAVGKACDCVEKGI
ncbi:hypothetical protein CDD83_8450 [Cordyceps sp. RAO-2017]|nr:hypothetical protein CDD83_8450 [Cordyceps sp. RAO-2017]